MSLKILLVGHQGRMGQSIIQVASHYGVEISETFNRGDDLEQKIANMDAIIDFSSPALTYDLLNFASKHKKPVVIGTTGHTQDEKEKVAHFATQIPIVWSSNFSIGINLLYFLVKKTAQILDSEYHTEIIESHHSSKKDAPGGTACKLLQIVQNVRNLADSQILHGRHGMYPEGRLNDEIGVHSLRAGDTVGEHTVYFAGQGERLELTHKASDRKIYASGALRAAQWAVNKEPGFYSMENILGLTEEKSLL